MFKTEIKKIGRHKYIHIIVDIRIFKLVFFKYKNKFNIRFEISRGWE